MGYYPHSVAGLYNMFVVRIMYGESCLLGAAYMDLTAHSRYNPHLIFRCGFFYLSRGSRALPIQTHRCIFIDSVNQMNDLHNIGIIEYSEQSLIMDIRKGWFK